MKNRKLNWIWVIVFSVIFVIFLSTILPKVSEYTSEVVGDFDSPDSSVIYSADDLYKMTDNYGEDGRSAYVRIRWTFDVIWPFVYTLFLASWLIKLSEYVINLRWVRYAFVLPIIAMTFDFLENIGATVVMIRYPLKSGLVATLTPLMSLIKWVTLSSSFAMLGVIVILIVLARIKLKLDKKRAQNP